MKQHINYAVTSLLWFFFLVGISNVIFMANSDFVFTPFFAPEIFTPEPFYKGPDLGYDPERDVSYSLVYGNNYYFLTIITSILIYRRYETLKYYGKRIGFVLETIGNFLYAIIGPFVAFIFIRYFMTGEFIISIFGGSPQPEEALDHMIVQTMIIFGCVIICVSAFSYYRLFLKYKMLREWLEKRKLASGE
ncbi:hypothetical protein [Algicola sagamiensis]|uniref:hypothetical protein n=1 Tax=Algicola sagamiensis TaxID=163869 RepID=UPI0012FCC82E|nr:hypothetical protein [Algicola sagamiensis]